MERHPRIALDPAVAAGKPVVRGTRLTVEFVIGLVAQGWTEADLVANYPGVTREDILGCLEFARDLLSITAFYPDKLAGMQRAERLTLKEWLLADGPRIEDHELPWFDRSYRRGRKPPE